MPALTLSKGGGPDFTGPLPLAKMTKVKPTMVVVLIPSDLGLNSKTPDPESDGM